MDLSLIAPTQPYGALIFDCDGTLADTMPNHYRAWVKTLRSLGADMNETEFYQMGGMPTSTIIRKLNADYGYGLDVEKTHKAKEQQYVELLHSITEIEAVANIARANLGKVPMAVASGATRDILYATLDAVKLTPLFQQVISSDMVKHGKPAPDIFLLAAEKLGVDPKDCIVYEDGDPGIEAAHRAGMRVIDVRVLWGYKYSASYTG